MNNYRDINYIYEYEVMLSLMFSQGKSYGKKKINSISFYQIIIIWYSSQGVTTLWWDYV